MDYIIIEPRVYQEMQALVKQLLERISRYRELTDPAAHSRWLSADEVCKALKISKHALHYYRSNGIIPFTSLGNKIFFREKDIAHILQNNLIKPGK